MNKIYWRWRILWVAFETGAVTCLGSATAAQDSGEELMMVMGDQRVFDAREVDGFSESTKGVIAVKVPRDGRKLIVTALRPGNTSLLLIDKSGGQRTILITVFPMLPDTVLRELSELLKKDANVTLRKVGPRVFIDGAVPSKGALKRIDRAAAAYRGQVVSLVELDPSVVEHLTNIRLDLIFIEMTRREGDTFGVWWPPAFGATGALEGTLDLMTGSLSAAYKVVDQALPSLEAAAHYGWVKIKKQATVVTTNGHRAVYSAGGEVNIAVAGSQAAELRSIPYGASLSVIPRLSPDEQLIDLEVSAEVSDLTDAVNDVPGRTVSRVETLVHMGLGQSIMLSGLNAHSEGTTKEGLPYLSRIPILGLLFGTRHHREDQTEGIIVITPTVLDRLNRTGKQRLDEALLKFQHFTGKFD